MGIRPTLCTPLDLEGVEIARFLFVAGKLSPKQHEKTRYDLLEYCKRDTWATVKLLERLKELADV